MTDVLYPHLQRPDFVTALAIAGPAGKPQRRFLMVLSAMADHWSLVMPDPLLLASVFSVKVNTVRDWLYQFHEDRWLSDVPGTDLATLHLPKNSAAYQAVEQKFEWHTRSHAPLGGCSRAVTTYVKSSNGTDPIPLSRARIQLAVDSAGKTREKQFAYLSFVQESLSAQPPYKDTLAGQWDRYLEGY
jgi:hypothetical protein